MENRSRKVAVIGGGASGASLLWCLTRASRSRDAWSATLFHDEDELGGHSRTIPIRFDASGRAHVAKKGDPGPVVAYFFADFYEVPADFDRAVGGRGYLWSPRTWSFHPWPG